MEGKKYIIRTYDNGIHAILAPDIISAINSYLGNTGRSIFSIWSAIDAAEMDR